MWDWELMNDTKPMWLRKPKEVSDEEYNNFYKSFSKVSWTCVKSKFILDSFTKLSLINYIVFLGFT